MTSLDELAASHQTMANTLDEIARQLASMQQAQEIAVMEARLGSGTPMRMGAYPEGASVLAAGTSDPGSPGSVTDVMNASGNVIISQSGITIKNGALSLEDEFGSTVAVASGFSGGWADFVASGLYNGSFAAAVPGALPDGRTAALPYWEVAHAGLTSLDVVADIAWPGGRYVEGIPIADDPDAYFVVRSDPVAIAPGTPLVIGCAVAAVVGGAGSVPTVQLHVHWLDSAGAEIEQYAPVLAVFNATNTSPGISESGPLAPPTGARYAKVNMVVFEGGTAYVATKMRLGAVFARSERRFGLEPYVWTGPASPYATIDATSAYPAGRLYFAPFNVHSTIDVYALDFMSADTSGARSMEWRVYVDADRSMVLREVPGVHGSKSWTASAAGMQAAPVAVGGRLSAGSYFLALRNSHATNALTLAYATYPNGTYPMPLAAYKDGHGALGATLDASTLTVGTAAIGMSLAGWFGGGIWG